MNDPIQIQKKLISALLIFLLLVSPVPQAAFAAEETYEGEQGTNPWITLETINNSAAKSQITTENSKTEYYHNTIKTELDAEQIIRFRFVPSGSSTTNATKSDIETNTMPHIGVYLKEDALTQKNASASCDDGTLLLEQVKVNSSEQTNVDIAVKAGSLQPGTEYALVFDKGLGVKKSDNTIGKDIVFFFKTKAVVRGLTLNRTSLSAAIGHTETLTALYDNQTVDSADVTWTSSKTAVAEVDHGTVTMISEGSAEITAEYRDSRVSCHVTVGAIAYGMQGLDNQFSMIEPWDIKVLSENNQRYYNRINTKFHDDEDLVFLVKMSAGMAQFNEAEFQNSKLAMFTVHENSEDGAIEAAGKPSEGQAAIEYAGFDEERQNIELRIAKGSLKRGRHCLVVGKDLQGNAPGKILGKDIVFEFMVTDPQETEPVTGLSLNWEELTLSTGAQLTLQPIFEPEQANNKNLSWSSSNESIAVVSQEGAVTAKAAGLAVITATAEDGGHQAQCRLTVMDSEIQLNAWTLELSKNQEETLKAVDVNGDRVQPQWQSDKEEIASVDAEGKVKGISPGHTLLWAFWEGKKAAVCAVTVTSGGNYGFQGINGNSVCLKSPDSLYVKEITQEYYFNGINGPVDGTQDILFGFTISAGMNNFNKDNVFVKNSLPHIKVYRDYPGSDEDIAAQYRNTGDQAKLQMLAYDGKGTIYVKVPKLSLRSGTYYLVFGKAVCGNNIGKNLGKDVVFRFHVQWPSGTLQVQLPEDGETLEAAVKNRLEPGQKITEIEELLLTAKGYRLTEQDFRFIREEMGQTLKQLDFSRAELTENQLPAGALAGCIALEQISLPPITTLQKSALQGCNSLKKIKFTGETPPTVEDSTVLAGTALETVIVPSAALAAYRATAPWSGYTCYVETTGITLRQGSASVPEGRTISLAALVQTSNATDKSVEWISADESIATVKSGIVTGVKRGETVVIARTRDGGYEASCKITVKMPAPDIKLSREKATLYTTGSGHTLKLSAAVTGSEFFSAEDIIWYSSDEEIAEVTEDGLVTGKKAGVAVIYAYLEEYKAVCVVTVKAHTISLNKKTASIFAAGSGRTLTLKPSIDGTAVAGNKVEWSSGNSSTASVSRTGIVTGKKPGTAVITAKANGKSASCRVTVKAATLKLNKTKATIYTRGQSTLLLTSVVNGVKVSGTKVSWKSSNTRIATVSKSGVVNARKKGVVTITAKANGKSASCRVTVKTPTLTLAKSSAVIKKGKAVQIKAKATPKGKVTYRSKNKKIATVTTSGRVTGKKKGTTIIRVTCNGVTKNFKVRVK